MKAEANLVGDAEKDLMEYQTKILGRTRQQALRSMKNLARAKEQAAKESKGLKLTPKK
jgi:hypothetical protein